MTAASGRGRRGSTVPWGRVFRALSLAYGWTPAEILELSLPQVLWYMTSDPQPGERRYLSADAARALAQQRRAERKAWVDRKLAECVQPR